MSSEMYPLNKLNNSSMNLLKNNVPINMPTPSSFYQKEYEDVARKSNNQRKKIIDSINATAENTSKSNMLLEKVIENQNDYIEKLKSEIAVEEQQLKLLRNIFNSGEDGVSVDKEIMKIIQKQIDEKHPCMDWVKNLGSDIAKDGIKNCIPIIIEALKMYLIQKGMNV